MAQSDKSAAPVSASCSDLLRFYETRGYGFDIGPGRKPAVVVVDFSIAFTKGTENFPGGGYDAEVAKCRVLLDAAREVGVPVLYTTIAYEPHMRDAGHWAVKIPWIRSLQLGSREAAIDERLDPRPDEPILVKKYPSAFFETDLRERLARAGIDTLIIAGCTTSACVRATTVDAMSMGFRPVIASDAVGDIIPALHAVNLADLRARYADARTVAELASYLAGLGR